MVRNLNFFSDLSVSILCRPSARTGYSCITARTFPDGSLNQAIWGPPPRTIPILVPI
jgi:hypothetical protein